MSNDKQLTAEEIYNKNIPIGVIGFPVVKNYILKAMAEFADQQNAELRKEVEELKNWKTGMIDIWMPVHSHVVNKNVLAIGNSISKEVLRRLEELDTLKNENNWTKLKQVSEQMAKALADDTINPIHALEAYNNLNK